MFRTTLRRLKDWTGFFAYTDPKGEYHRGKTLWDWLQLLIIPAVLAGFALWFNRSETIRQEAISLDRQQEESLQSYLNGMEYLLLEKYLRTSVIDSEVREVARARTLTVLKGLDPERKGAVVTFLWESGLIFIEPPDSERDVPIHPIVSLWGADLREINLVEAHMNHVHLANADLTGADLRKAYLLGANLWEANLTGADLREVNLTEATLWWADLTGADLREADLLDAGIYNEKLALAKSLEGATLPDGTKRDGQYIKDEEGEGE